MTDARVSWLQRTVQAVLPVEGEKWAALLQDEKAKQDLAYFLDSAPENTTALFYLRLVSEQCTKDSSVEGAGEELPTGDEEGSAAEVAEEPAEEVVLDVSEVYVGDVEEKETKKSYGRSKTLNRDTTQMLSREVLTLTVGSMIDCSLDRMCLYFMKHIGGAVSPATIQREVTFGTVEGTFLRDLEVGVAKTR